MIPHQRIQLGVNIDHVATVRQARGSCCPDPVQAALMAETAGADSITLHLREDRRHIQARDVRLISEVLQTRLNLEIAITDDMLVFAENLRPVQVCLVPEKRQELTTEGGLNVAEQLGQVKAAYQRLAAKGIRVALFIDPEAAQIEAAVASGAAAIELHTGAYAEAAGSAQAMKAELERLQGAISIALDQGLTVNAGHGLNYQNVEPVAALAGLHELNIGHAIIARALFTGLHEAVSTMKQQILQAAASHS